MIQELIKAQKNKEDLLPLVEKEVELIKSNFTEEEINRLVNAHIDPNMADKCIYGTMTGDCNSERVIKFIENNITTVVKVGEVRGYKIGDKYDPEIRSYYFMTPLEDYIYDDSKTEEPSLEAKERLEKVLNLLLN